MLADCSLVSDNGTETQFATDRANVRLGNSTEPFDEQPDYKLCDSSFRFFKSVEYEMKQLVVGRFFHTSS